MTDPRAPRDEDRLRAAFQSLADEVRVDVSEADLDRIWRAIGGELPADQRRELIDRVAAEPALAEAWRVACELHPASRAAASTSRPTWRAPMWLAAAAVLVVGVAAGLVYRFGPPNDTVRGSDHYVIEATAADSALPRDGFRLRWTPGPRGSRYQVRVTTEDLRVLATVSDLDAPELVVDPAALASVPSGARVLWQVDAAVPGANHVVSPTFIARVR